MPCQQSLVKTWTVQIDAAGKTLIESGWLLAAALVPLFFNPYSSRIFEPDKIALLRSLALLACAGWGLVLLSRAARAFTSGAGVASLSPPGSGRIWSKRLLWASLLYLAVSLLSSTFSIAPRLSWLGSYERAQGFLTTASCLVVFFSLALELRRKEQLDRLIAVIILTSFPVALYGILQHFHLDPLHFPDIVTKRCSSSAGNPIFLGGYLIMIVPLTLSKILPVWKGLVGKAGRADAMHALILSLATTLTLVIGIVLLIFDVSIFWTWLAIGLSLAGLTMLYIRIPVSRTATILFLCLPLTYGGCMLGLTLLDLLFTAQGSWYFWVLAVSSLIFVVFLTVLGRTLLRQSIPALVLASLVVLLIAQLACLLFTQSRGALLGFGASMLFFFLLGGLVRRSRWISWGVLGGLLLSAGLLIAVALNPPEVLRQTGSIPGLDRLTSFTSGDSVAVRRHIWENTLLLITNPADSVTNPPPFLEQSPFPFSRHLLGYGPETFRFLFSLVHPPELFNLEHNKTPDRAHNVLLNEIITHGWLGTFCLLSVLTLALCCGYACLGLKGPPLRMFMTLWILGGAAGLGIALISQNTLLRTLMLPAGLLLGVLCHLVVLLIRFPHELDFHQRSRAPLLPLALMAALLAHFVELQFGFAVAPAALHFWMFTGLLGAVCLRPRLLDPLISPAASSESAGAKPLPIRHPGPGEGRLQVLDILASVLVVSILYAMLPPPHAAAGFPPKTLVHDWNWGAPLVLLLGTVLLTWVLRLGQGTVGPFSAQTLSFPWFPAAAGVLFTLVFSHLLEFTFTHPLTWPLAFSGYGLSLAALMLGLCLTLTHRPISSFGTLVPPLSRIMALSLFPLLLTAFGLLAFLVFFRPVQADMLYRLARTLQQHQQNPASILFLKGAIRLAPHQARYQEALGKAYLRVASGPGQQDSAAWLDLAEQTLSRTLQTNPLEPRHHTNLAGLYTVRAQYGEEGHQNEMLVRAHQALTASIRLRPREAGLLLDLAANLIAREETARAKVTLDVAATVTARPNQLLRLGELYLAVQAWERAEDAYGHVLSNTRNSVEASSGLGYALARQKRYGDAVAAYQQAIALAPQNYNDHKNLGLVYESLGQTDSALESLEKAWALAPESEQRLISKELDNLKKKAAH